MTNSKDPQDLSSRIETVLEDFRKQCVNKVNNGSGFEVTKERLTALIKEEMLALIGEDEYPKARTGAPEQPQTVGDDRRIQRNLMRATLRTKVEQLTGKGDKT